MRCKSGWWPSASATAPTSFKKAMAAAKFLATKDRERREDLSACSWSVHRGRVGRAASTSAGGKAGRPPSQDTQCLPPARLRAQAVVVVSSLLLMLLLVEAEEGGSGTDAKAKAKEKGRNADPTTSSRTKMRSR